MATTRTMRAAARQPEPQRGGDTDSARRDRGHPVLRLTLPLGALGAVLLAAAGYVVQDVYEGVRRLREDHARMEERVRALEREVDRLRDRLDAAHPAGGPSRD